MTARVRESWVIIIKIMFVIPKGDKRQCDSKRLSKEAVPYITPGVITSLTGC